MSHFHRFQPTLIDRLMRCPCGAVKDERTAPFQPHSATSVAAAQAIRPHMGRQQERVLHFLQTKGDAGATDEEIAEALGLNPSAARPRRVELQEHGLVADSGRRRQTRSGRSAVVWISLRRAA